MMTHEQRTHAANIVAAIEGGFFQAEQLPYDVQELVSALGGTRYVQDMTPGATALYLLALMIRQG